MSPERAGALATALSLSRVQRARLRAAFFNRWRATTLAAAVHATRRLLDPTPRAEPSPEAAIGALRRDLARLLVRAVAELGHVCFCRAVDVEGVGRVWTPARDDDPLRALFRVISSSKAFYAAQKHTPALW